MERFGAGGVVSEVVLEGEVEATGVAVMRTSFAPGSVVPLHAHPEGEVHRVLDGNLMIYSAGAWTDAGAGTSVEVKPGDFHAMRNPGSTPAVMVTLMPASLLAFIREVAPRADERTASGAVARLQERRSGGYLNADRADNEAIGLSFPP